MEKKFIIRKCVKEDADAIFKMICQLEGENPQQKEFDSVYFENLDTANIHYVCIEVDAAPVAFASMHIQNLLHHTGKVAEIQEMFVEPIFRTKGYGEEMLWYLRDLAESCKCKHIEASCNIVRDKSHIFLANRGMNPTHHKFTERL